MDYEHIQEKAKEAAAWPQRQQRGLAEQGTLGKQADGRCYAASSSSGWNSNLRLAEAEKPRPEIETLIERLEHRAAVLNDTILCLMSKLAPILQLAPMRDASENQTAATPLGSRLQGIEAQIDLSNRTIQDMLDNLGL